LLTCVDRRFSNASVGVEVSGGVDVDVREADRSSSKAPRRSAADQEVNNFERRAKPKFKPKDDGSSFIDFTAKTFLGGYSR
jgi:hypothetical protein